MGQKVHPKIQRIGIIYSWPSRWFQKNKRDYAKLFHQDLEIKKFIEKELREASISQIEIHRASGNVTINIHTAKPGIIIGRQGENIAELKEKLNEAFNARFDVHIQEIKKPDLDAKLLAENIVRQIEKRISYRRAAKMGIQKAMEQGAIGAKVLAGGRLNGVEIARSEYFTDGKIPLQTFRADIDYAYVPANTKYGVIGVKVWIYKGEIFHKRKKQVIQQTASEEIKQEPREFLPT